MIGSSGLDSQRKEANEVSPTVIAVFYQRHSLGPQLREGCANRIQSSH